MKTIHKILILSLSLCISFTAQAQDDRENDRFIEIGYSAMSFEDVTASGYYGIGATILPWNIKQDLYVGFYISPVACNYGLSDFDSMLVQLGPALGYYITPSLTATTSLNVMCGIPVEEDNSSLSWGMSLSPTLHIGKKRGLFVGPSLTVPFSEGAEVSFGFKAGFFF